MFSVDQSLHFSYYINLLYVLMVCQCRTWLTSQKNNNMAGKRPTSSTPILVLAEVSTKGSPCTSGLHLQYGTFGALGVFVAEKSWRIKIKKEIASSCREVSVSCLSFVFSVYLCFMC